MDVLTREVTRGESLSQQIVTIRSQKESSETRYFTTRNYTLLLLESHLMHYVPEKDSCEELRDSLDEFVSIVLGDEDDLVILQRLLSSMLFSRYCDGNDGIRHYQQLRYQLKSTVN